MTSATGQTASTMLPLERSMTSSSFCAALRRMGKSVLPKDTVATLCGRDDVELRHVIYLPTVGMRATDLNPKFGRGTIVCNGSS